MKKKRWLSEKMAESAFITFHLLFKIAIFACRNYSQKNDLSMKNMQQEIIKHEWTISVLHPVLFFFFFNFLFTFLYSLISRASTFCSTLALCLGLRDLQETHIIGFVLRHRFRVDSLFHYCWSDHLIQTLSPCTRVRSVACRTEVGAAFRQPIQKRLNAAYLRSPLHRVVSSPFIPAHLFCACVSRRRSAETWAAAGVLLCAGESVCVSRSLHSGLRGRLAREAEQWAQQHGKIPVTWIS